MEVKYGFHSVQGPLLTERKGFRGQTVRLRKRYINNYLIAVKL